MFRIVLFQIIFLSYINAFETKQPIPSKHFDGKVTETFISEYMKGNGAKEINTEVGRNGIDGLFYKKENSKLKVYIIESKYNSSQLGNTKNGKQMSKTWKIKKIVEKINQLKKELKNPYINKEKIKQEIELLNQAKRIVIKGLDKSLLFKIKPQGNNKYKFLLQSIDKNGKIVGNIKNYKFSEKVIDLNKQYKTDSFENKLKKLLNHSIKKTNKIYKETQKLKELQTNSKTNFDKIQTQKEKIKKIELSKAKLTRKLSFKTATNSTSKTAVKMGIKTAGIGIASFASHIPIVGMFVQAAMDAYMMYQIEQNSQKIAQNTQNIQINSQRISQNTQYIQANMQNIQINRLYIKRLQQEQKILGLKIDKNTLDINNIFNKLIVVDSKLGDLSSQIKTLSLEISKVNSLAKQNTKAIQEIKNGAFYTAIKKMNEFYETKESKYLNDAILMFDFTKEIKNKKVFYLINYYLTITRYEQYLLKPNNHDLEEMKINFTELVEFSKKNNDFLSLVNTLYIGISDLNKQKLTYFKNKLTNLTKLIIQNKIKNKKFDDAISLSLQYENVLGDSTKTSDLYKLANQARIKNFNKYKNFETISEINSILDNNQNMLLNKEAVKYLYNLHDFKDTIKILQTKRLDDDFRLKVFYNIFQYTGNKEKLDQLKKI